MSAQVPSSQPQGPSAEGPLRFADATAAAGLHFRHSNGSSGRNYFVEQLGSGAAFLDYDGDGWLDVFFAQGVPLPGFTEAAPEGNTLYRNNRNGTFTNVTARSGLKSSRFAFGVAAADYDNDGDTDLFVTALGGDLLYRNDGRGRFTDVAARAGVSGSELSTSASFLDYDGDGWLDLVVARYGPYSLDTDAGCRGSMGSTTLPGPVASGGTRRMRCGPVDFDGVTNLLYRNNGDGTFLDVTASSGFSASLNHGLGIAVADYDEDGRPDIFVASDKMPNLLFMNRGDGRFTEDALTAGVAVGAEGIPYAGMGVDTGDYDNDGRLDLFITNYENEPSSLYRNLGGGLFSDQSQRSGVSTLSWVFLKWGCRFIDFNGDGLLDLFVANGHVDSHAVSYPVQMEHLQKGRGYTQRAQVYLNAGRGRYTEVSKASGPYFSEKYVARGAAFGDYDNDGDVDVVVTNNNQPAVLLRNDTRAVGRWARLDLKGAPPNRDALGTVVRVTSGGITQTHVVKSGGSYLSDHDRRPLFGLPGKDPASAEIRWPCGATQKVALTANRTTTVKEIGCKRTNPGKAR